MEKEKKEKGKGIKGMIIEKRGDFPIRRNEVEAKGSIEGRKTIESTGA